MLYRTLGKTGLRVSELGMGCAGIGKTLQRRDDAGAIATLRTSLEQGVNFFETAPGYCAGDSERLIGKAFSGKREQVTIVSKVGVRSTLIGRFLKSQKHLLRPLRSFLDPRKSTLLPQIYMSQKRIDFSADFIVESLNKSLSRLRTDYLDILLLHHPSVEALRLPAFKDTFVELKKAGKIRHWGISADTLEQATMSLEIPGVEVVQLDISMLSRSPLETFLPRAASAGVGIIARRVLERGLLTSATTSTKADWWMSDERHLSSLKKQAAQLRSLQSENRTLTQAALLFVRSLDEVATSVVGYSSLDHLFEILPVYSMQLLSEDELARTCPLAGNR